MSVLSAVAVFMATAVISTTPSAADHTTIFELDGNTADDISTTPPDWSTFFDANGDLVATPPAGGFADAGFDADYAFPDLSTYTGGSKDILDVSGWSCTDSNNLGGKFDIINAYAAIYEVPTTSGTYTEGDQLLFFGIERAATEGDGNMGFWFLQDGTVDCEKTSSGKAPAFTGNHVDGDIFVVAGFSNGGIQASVTAFRWNGGAGGSLSATPFVTADQLCTGAAASHNACGIVNTTEIATDAGKPWPSPDKNGGDLDVNAFYEGFVRIAAADAAVGCFATFVANTRSSTSPTATIHDFSRGDFPTCRPSTTMTGLATPTLASPEVAVIGDSVTYTFPEENDGNEDLTNVYVVTDNSACNNVLTPAVATLEAGDTATFSCTITKSSVGVITIRAVGHGTSELGDVTVCGADALPFPAPSTAVCDPDEQDSARAVWIEPGTEMTISASPTTVKEGDTVTFTITEKNDGIAPAGYNSYLDLTSVAVSTDNTECNGSLVRTIPADSTDVTLSLDEVWTYTCTVTAPADDFTLVATGTGTVLAGTSHARTVTYSAPAGDPPTETCTNSSGTSSAPGVFCDSEEQVSTTVTVISPSTKLTISASAIITYTFTEENDSLDAPLTLPTAGVRESILTAEEGITTVCNETAVAYTIGDDDDDKILDPGETWTFTCTGSLAGPTGDDSSSTSKVATGIGNGKDATGSNVTYCSSGTSSSSTTVCDPGERDRVTVTITGQPRGHDPASA